MNKFILSFTLLFTILLCNTVAFAHDNKVLATDVANVILATNIFVTESMKKDSQISIEIYDEYHSWVIDHYEKTSCIVASYTTDENEAFILLVPAGVERFRLFLSKEGLNFREMAQFFRIIFPDVFSEKIFSEFISISEAQINNSSYNLIYLEDGNILTITYRYYGEMISLSIHFMDLLN